MRTPKGRLSFVKITELQYHEDDVDKENGAYTLNLIFDKATDVSALKNAAQQLLIDTLGLDTAKSLLKAGKLKTPFKKAEEMLDGEGRRYSGYEEDGATVLSLKAYGPFTCIDMAGRSYASNGRLMEKDATGALREVPNSKLASEEFYAGCYGMAAIFFQYYEKGGGKGVNARICGLRKMEDGEPLGGSGGMKADEVIDFFADIPTIQPDASVPGETQKAGGDNGFWDD